MKKISTNTIPEKHFNCPKCGAACGDFYIETDCEEEDLCYPSDYVCCSKCGYSIKYTSLEKKYLENVNMIKCPNCKGTGYIKNKNL